VKARGVKVETVDSAESNGRSVITLSASASPSPPARGRSLSRKVVPPLRRQNTSGFRSRSRSRHSRAAHSVLINMFDNIVDDANKKPKHPTPVALLQALKKPQKYMHVFITYLPTNERAHIFQTYPKHYFVSYHLGNKLVDVQEGIDPVRVAREFMSRSATLKSV
jgi:hypothetical protein